MKKLILLVFLAMISAILFTACRSDSELDSGDGGDVHGADENLTGDEIRADNESWEEDGILTENANVVGLPDGEYTYLQASIPIKHDNNHVRIQTITALNATIYGVASVWSEDTAEGGILFFSIDLDTEELFFYPQTAVLADGYHSVEAIAVNDDGEITFVSHEFIYHYEPPITEEILLLSQIDTLGNVAFSVDITEYFEPSESDYWISPPRDIILDDAGNIYVKAHDGSISQFDATGAYQFSVPQSEKAWTSVAGTPFRSTDGTILFPIRNSDEGNMLYSIDNETRSLIPHQPLPDVDTFFLPALYADELFMIKEFGVYSYCLELNEQNRVFHWLEVDVRSALVFPVGEGRFALLDFSDHGWWTNTITVLTRTAAQDDGRTIVTMASLAPNYWRVSEFNRQSTEYRIVVLDYSNDDISAALTRFNIDMIAGNIPDIIDFTYLNYHNLANGGFLADINVWFDNDSHISRTDFHERIFELLEIGGNLYAVTPSFSIWTYIAPASLVGSSPGMTLEQLMHLDMQFNGGDSLLRHENSQSFIWNHTTTSRSSLIDFETGAVRFETDEFIQVLEYANRLEYASRIAETELSVPNYEQVPFEVDIRRGNNHISSVDISHLNRLHDIELYAGTEITPIGFPVANGVGSLMLPGALYGIGEGAQNSSGAWAFLRFLLTSQQEARFHGISVSRAAFDEWANQAMIPPPVVDSPELSDLYVDGVRIEFVAITQDQVNRTLEMIETLGELLVDGDEIVANIVAEETDAFFRGHGSAEDAARIIQSRVQIYVSERR